MKDCIDVGVQLDLGPVTRILKALERTMIASRCLDFLDYHALRQPVHSVDSPLDVDRYTVS